MSVNDSAPVDHLPAQSAQSEQTAVRRFISDIRGQKNFVYFGLMNLIQVSIQTGINDLFECIVGVYPRVYSLE